MNAFELARPKAAEAPAKLPNRTNRSTAPLQGSLRHLPMQPARKDPAEVNALQALKDSQFRRVGTGKRTPAERARAARKEIKP